MYLLQIENRAGFSYSALLENEVDEVLRINALQDIFAMIFCFGDFLFFLISLSQLKVLRAIIPTNMSICFKHFRCSESTLMPCEFYVVSVPIDTMLMSIST